MPRGVLPFSGGPDMPIRTSHGTSCYGCGPRLSRRAATVRTPLFLHHAPHRLSRRAATVRIPLFLHHALPPLPLCCNHENYFFHHVTSFLAGPPHQEDDHPWEPFSPAIPPPLGGPHTAFPLCSHIYRSFHFQMNNFITKLGSKYLKNTG